MPPEKETTGKWGKSLTLIVGADEPMDKDKEMDTLAIGSKTTSFGAVLPLSGQIVAGIAENVGIDIQGAEELTPRSQAVDVPVEEADTPSIVLLCISVSLNGFSVIFLIDNGASECFVGAAFVEKNELKKTKTKEKLKIHLTDGTLRVPTYDAILGKPWLDRWNYVIDWKKNTLQWRVGPRLISVTRVPDPQEPTIASSIFEQRNSVEQISAQRMKNWQRGKQFF